MPRRCSLRLWSSSTLGKRGTSGYSPSRKAPSILVSIKSMVFTRAFLLQSCQRPLAADQAQPPGGLALANLNTAQQNEALLACQDITDTLYPGFDLTEEIRATQAQGLGDTVLIDGPGGIGAFAVCHYGPNSEAGADACFVKFGAVRAGVQAERELSSPARCVRGASGRGWHAKRASRCEYGAPRSLSTPCLSRVSHRNSRRDHAPAQRSRLLPPRGPTSLTTGVNVPPFALLPFPVFTSIHSHYFIPGAGIYPGMLVGR